MLLRSRLLIYMMFLSLGACGGMNGSPSSGSSFAPSVEASYCSTPTVYAPGITITATAQFRSRILFNGLQGPTAARGIPFAEVQVLNSAGTVIQCGETSLTGAISVTVPKAAGSYTLKVLSRADNSHYKASVLNNASANVPYSISVDLSVTGAEVAPKAVSLPVANYTGTLEGGAFNILEQVYKANKFLQDNTSCAGCTTFDVAPKARLYWTPGLSPGSYYGSPSTAISFFSKSDDYSIGLLKGVYILGGINGDINCTDTDHFDDSVILHEYGHFLEDAYAGSDSPGGSHDGNRLIDPRLAWSEGWANFIQGAIIPKAQYEDSIGNNSCGGGAGSTSFGVNLDLETPQLGQDKMTSGDNSVNGQGIFREVSVTRALYDIYTATAGGDNIGADLGFPLMWKAFSSPAPNGLSGNSVVFRNMGLYNSILRPLAVTAGKSANFDIVIGNTNEHQDPKDAMTGSLRREYGLPVTPGVATCPFTIKGVVGTFGGVTNFLENEDFFQYYFDGSAANSVITLKYSGTGGTPDDLDLYIYNRTHVYGNTSTMAGKSARIYPEAGQGIEVVSLAGKPAGYYMINVSSDRDSLGNGSGTAYQLETNSGTKYLCP